MSTTIDSLEIQITTNANSASKKIEALAKSLEKLRDNSNLNKVVENLDKLSGTLNKLSGTKNNLSGLSSQLNKTSNSMRSVGSSSKEMGASLNAGSINIMSMIDNFQSLMFVVNGVVNSFASLINEAMGWDGIQYRFGRVFGEDAEEMYQYILKVNEALGINVQEFMQYSSIYGSLLKGFGLNQDKVTTISRGLSEMTYDLWAANNDVVKNYEDVAVAVKSAITGEIEPIRNLGIAMTEASLQEFIDSTNLAGISIEKMTEAQKAEVRYAAMVNAAMNQGIVGTYAREMHTAEGAVRSLSQSFKGLVQALGSLFIPALQKVIPYVTAFVEILTQLAFRVASIFGIEIQPITWDTKGVTDLSTGVADIATGTGDATKGLKDTAKAAKKLKDYTMGFDELNVISPPTDSASGGGGAGKSGGAGGFGEGLDLDTLWDESVFEQASQKVKELKDQISEFVEKWKGGLTLLAASLATLAASKFWTVIGSALNWGDKFLGVMQTISKIASAGIVIAIQFMLVKNAFSNAMEEGSMWEYIKGMIFAAIGTGILYSMLGPTGLVIGLGVTAVASISAIIDNGGIDNIEGVTVALTGVASAIGAVALAAKTLKIGEMFPNSWLANMASGVSMLKGGFITVGQFAEGVFGTKLINAISTLATKFSWLTSSVGTFLAGISAPMWAGIAVAIAAVVSVVHFLRENWDEVVDVAKRFFAENITPKLEEIAQHWEKIKSALKGVKDAFLDAIPEGLKVVLFEVGEYIKYIVDKVKEWFKSIEWLEAIGKVFEVIGGVIFGVLSTVLAGAFNAIIAIIENFVEVFSGIVQVVSGVIEGIIAIFSGGDVVAAAEKIINGVVDVFGGLWGLVSDPIIEFFDGVIKWFTDLWDELVGHSIVPDTIEGIVDCFLSLPKEILKPLETFVKNVLDKFKGLWSSLKSWYTSNIKPKFTKTYWSGVFDTVRSSFGEKLDAVWNKVKSIWSTITSWYNSNVKPKFTKAYWSGVFDTIRSGLATKLDAAWTAVKNFFSVEEWKKKVTSVVNTIKNNFKMPSLPKISLSVTWSTNVGKLKKAVYEALGLDGWPSLKWTAYAAGGFPDMGEMFIAREAGPELVGRIGNKTTVANNDQIVAAVSQGVYSAVRSAMSEGNNSDGQNINVYLDGKQIYASVKRVEAQRGRNLMGNQLGYLY